MNIWRFSLLSLLAIVLAAAPNSSAAPTEPGTYRGWGGEIDCVVINRTFRADDYQDIVVEPLDITKVAVPERKGESPAEVFAVLPSLKPAFLVSLQKNLRRRTPMPGATGKALIIRVRVTKADPGTRSPKFGDVKANAAKLEVSGEVIDPATSLILVQFTQERWSGLITIGKTSGQLLRDAAGLIGEDVGHLISAF
ncbi:MAG: hypothetical protein ACR2G0_13245 [Chthoniobacterales bacterium]